MPRKINMNLRIEHHIDWNDGHFCYVNFIGYRDTQKSIVLAGRVHQVGEEFRFTPAAIHDGMTVRQAGMKKLREEGGPFAKPDQTEQPFLTLAKTDEEWRMVTPDWQQYTAPMSSGYRLATATFLARVGRLLETTVFSSENIGYLQHLARRN